MFSWKLRKHFLCPRAAFLPPQCVLVLPRPSVDNPAFPLRWQMLHSVLGLLLIVDLLAYLSLLYTTVPSQRQCLFPGRRVRETHRHLGQTSSWQESRTAYRGLIHHPSPAIPRPMTRWRRPGKRDIAEIRCLPWGSSYAANSVANAKAVTSRLSQETRYLSHLALCTRKTKLAFEMKFLRLAFSQLPAFLIRPHYTEMRHIFSLNYFYHLIVHYSYDGVQVTRTDSHLSG